jgi:hypothetical protein
VTTPGIPNHFSLSTSCFGSRLSSIQDQIFAAVGMGFRRIELGLAEAPPSMEGIEDSQRETGVEIPTVVAGCRDSLNGSMVVEKLSSLVPEETERALNSVRRHVRLAHGWGCSTIVVRGSRVEDPVLQSDALLLSTRLVFTTKWMGFLSGPVIVYSPGRPVPANSATPLLPRDSIESSVTFPCVSRMDAVLPIFSGGKNATAELPTPRLRGGKSDDAR